MADVEMPSCSVGDLIPVEVKSTEDESGEPEKKMPKLAFPSCNEKLEDRLGGILCCAVCLDLPSAAIYQCTNGHLMCAGCFTHLLADARLRDECATCPNCRVEINKTSPSRNLAVEKAVSELPAHCQFCGKEYPRNTLSNHEKMNCEERLTLCQYSRIGCPWRGPYHEAKRHEEECAHPHKTGAQVLEALDAIEKKNAKQKKLFCTVYDLLSYEKIVFNDLQFKPYRTDEFVHKLYYETAKFTAFNNQWVVKAGVNDNQKDPTSQCKREMSYRLILKTKALLPMSLHYMLLRGPYGDLKVGVQVYKFHFTEQDVESPPVPLLLPDSAECNRLLACKTINFRLIMFLSAK